MERSAGRLRFTPAREPEAVTYPWTRRCRASACSSYSVTPAFPCFSSRLSLLASRPAGFGGAVDGGWVSQAGDWREQQRGRGGGGSGGPGEPLPLLSTSSSSSSSIMMTSSSSAPTTLLDLGPLPSVPVPVPSPRRSGAVSTRSGSFGGGRGAGATSDPCTSLHQRHHGPPQRRGGGTSRLVPPRQLAANEYPRVAPASCSAAYVRRSEWEFSGPSMRRRELVMAEPGVTVIPSISTRRSPTKGARICSSCRASAGSWAPVVGRANACRPRHVFCVGEALLPQRRRSS